jgi:hypothetical protein
MWITHSPGDLGYWAGYQVVKAYHDRSPNKREALADILNVTPDTANRILKDSGVGR